MNRKERVKKLINWLVFSGVVEGQNDLAIRLGYSKSYMSQVCNEAKSISDAFIGKLCSLDENLSPEWFLEGVGSMFKDNPFSEFSEVDSSGSGRPSSGDVVVDSEVWEVIKNQAQSLSSRDAQINELIAMLRSQLEDSKKDAVQQGDRATCADAV